MLLPRELNHALSLIWENKGPRAHTDESGEDVCEYDSAVSSLQFRVRPLLLLHSLQTVVLNLAVIHS